ncbi:MAG: bifunctional folylpolyglutamate synthase/dihydrofolate synthase [Methylobacteriaceae bacterium]|nr:bifunctional folylpolyglutamate synthase/dihydrofolate synthase [Methylobacteriaceae bacterium]
MASSDEIIARALALHPKLIDLSLDRMDGLLARLGHPERRLPPVLHVAGTNGKGSTIAFMRGILEAAGLKVHVYTSPHLVRFHERIRLAGRLVDEDRLAATLIEVERVNAGAPATVFEVTTAAAFALFADEPADALLLETGLGGRADATNVVARPAAAVVTPVGFDHAEFLGATIPAIAGEKAGIFKRGCPAVIAPQDYPEADEVLETRARAAGAGPVRVGGQDFTIHAERGRLVYEDEDALLDLPVPRLVGRHQYVNAGTAVAAIRASSFGGLPTEAYERGIAGASWPGRLQRLTRGRLLDALPPGAELWLDGGHNIDGARAVAGALADLEDRSSAPLVLICGLLQRKDADGYLAQFRGLAREVVAVPVAREASSRDPTELAAIAERLGLRATTAPGIVAALRSLDATIWDRAPRVLVCGSLYLVGEALALNETPPE